MTATIRAARPAEAAALSTLAIRSKRHWGYDDSFIAATREDLDVTPDQIARNICFVAERDGAVIGFYLLEADELIRLFVAPERFGEGIGRALMAHMADQASRTGIASVTIVADPHAAPFYEACGARRDGIFKSRQIPGRELPILKLEIAPKGGD